MTSHITDDRLIVGLQHRKTAETICTPCAVRAMGTDMPEWLPIYEGDTHSGQFDDDIYPVTIPVEFHCARCGTLVEA